jgi:hypothetical protein
MRFTISGCDSTFVPTKKNVAFTFRSFNKSNNRGVFVACGPSSKVSATCCPSTLHRLYDAFFAGAELIPPPTAELTSDGGAVGTEPEPS